MSRFISLAELPAVREQNPALDWQFEPSLYVDQDRIGVNVDRLTGIASVAGLGGVTVRHYFGDLEPPKVSGTTITGINPDGSATG